MSKDFGFFSEDVNKWNYNKLINNDIEDPFNPKRKNNMNNNYNIHKWNSLIMLKSILKDCNFDISLLNWIHKKAFNGGKSDYWEILNITVYTFYYNLFKINNDIINYKNFRKYFLKNKIYFKTDKTINDFEGINDWRKEQELQEYNKLSSFNKILNKIIEIEDEELKQKYNIICMFLKDKIFDSAGLAKLC